MAGKHDPLLAPRASGELLLALRASVALASVALATVAVASVANSADVASRWKTTQVGVIANFLITEKTR